MKDKSFYDYVAYDLLGDVPDIRSRTMFGGWAIYKSGVIFGIIVDGELYFKVDDKNRPEFEKADSHPFVYARKDGKPITMSYWLVPEEIMENEEKLHDWVERSVRASKRSGKAK